MKWKWIDEKKNFSFRITNPKTKNIVLYCFFVFIATIFWFLQASNRLVQRDFTINVDITEVPENTTLLNDAPITINVSVKDRGGAFLRYVFSDVPSLKIKFRYYDKKNGHINVSPLQLQALLRRIFGSNASITTTQPSSIDVKYTDLPGKKVPIHYDLDIEPDFKFVIYGNVVTSMDSVTVYSDKATLEDVNEAYTYHVQETGLTDTLRRTVTIAPIVGAKVVPRTVEIMVPIEPMIRKSQFIPVSLRNKPSDVKLIVYPSMVRASYLVPKSEYKRTDKQITAIVNYNAIDFHSGSNKVAIKVGEAPTAFKDIVLDRDSVEYIIEK